MLHPIPNAILNQLYYFLIFLFLIFNNLFILTRVMVDLLGTKQEYTLDRVTYSRGNLGLTNPFNGVFERLEETVKPRRKPTWSCFCVIDIFKAADIHSELAHITIENV